jgi:hypothetical protein
MRALAVSVVLGVTILGPNPTAKAQADAKAILEKAVKAHGGKESLSKGHAISSKSKGSIELFGGLNFMQESISEFPGRIKETVIVETNGSKFTTITVLEGGKGWTMTDAPPKDLDDAALEEVKQATYLMLLGTLRFVDDKEFVVTPLSDSTVEGKPAAGVKVAHKGFRDASLYFSKDTGLLVKLERQAYDPTTMRDVMEERLILDYQDVEGAKVAKKILVKRDGKRFLDAEITEFKFLEKVDPAEFAKP